VDEGAAEAQLLLHTTGELARRAISKGGQPGSREQLTNPALPLLTTVTEQSGKEVGIFKD